MATYYAIKTGGNWSAATTWASSTGQTTGGSGVPTATDSVIIDSTLTGTITVDTATDVCGSLNCTGATGTLAFGTKTLTVSGNVTFGSGMTLTGTTGSLVINASSILTTNGKTIPGQLKLTGVTSTITLGSALAVTNTFTVDSTSSTSVITIATEGYNLTLGAIAIDTSLTMTGAGTVSGTTCQLSGATITLSANWTISGTFTGSAVGNEINGDYLFIIGGSCTNTSRALAGSATVILNGTGTLTCSATAGITINLAIWSSGTITLDPSNQTNYFGGTFTYVAGTIVNTGNTFNFDDGAILNVPNMMFNNLILGEVTLQSNIECSGTLTNQQNGISISPDITGSYNISCGTLSFGAITNNVSFPLVSGQTLTVNNSLIIYSNSVYTAELLSATVSSPAYLNYMGTLPNQKVYLGIFQDINALNSKVPIYNWTGGTLTRTSNIFNVSGYQIGGGCVII